MRKDASKVFQLGLLATALFTTFGQVHAESDEEMARLIQPESDVQFGIGVMNHDAPRSNQYTGMRDQGVYGLMDFNLVRRNEATGTWLKLDGRNLGLDNRELRVEHTRQGDWSYFAEYNQIVRNSPYTINTSASGVGTENPAENGAAAAKHNEQLKTERQIANLGFDKQLPGGFSVQVRFRNEEKDGSRLFGRGVGATTTIFLAEPINSTTKQFEATLGYAGEQLLLSGGYYGTSYDNHNTAIWGTGGVAATPSPTALPPDNMSHQLFLSGNYTFTPLTRSTFKLAYGRATQNDGFIPAPDPANPNRTGKSSLEGRLDTKLIQFGLTSRPMPKLNLLANFRYDDRDDKTPVVRYGATPAAGTSTFDGMYEPRSITTRAGKLEASYQLPMGYRVTGGYERDIKTRNVPTNSLASVTPRDTTDEASYRLELRRSLSETVNGAVAYIHSDRGGSEILTLRTLNGAVGSSLMAPLNVVNRIRDKIRLSADWTPLDPLSIQFAIESSDDSYSGREFGLKDGKGQNYSVDASYTFSEQWSATAWAAHNANSAKQTNCQSATATNGGVCAAGLNQWSANLIDTGDAIGLGFRGQPKSWLQVGGDLSYSHDRNQFQVSQTVVQATTTPPDAYSTVTRLKLFSKYSVDKNSDVRVDLMHERRKMDDWTWANFTFNDGTTVLSNPNQNVTFLGATYIYKFQ